MLDAEAVLLVGFVVKRFQLVDGQLVELVKIVPPLVPAAQLRAQVRVGNVAPHLRRNVERAHRQHVHAVAGDSAQRGRHAFHHPGMDVRAFAGGDVNPHPRSAKHQRTLELALGNHRPHAQPDAVEHQVGVVVLR